MGDRQPNSHPVPETSDRTATLPYRFGLAGGWIDQPFVSRFDPAPPGSMVVVSIEPDRTFMDRSGIATSTRRVAGELWPDGLPRGRSRDELVRALYLAENKEASQPSGSQDMIGLVYPGISRLDYDIAKEGGLFPAHIENTTDAATLDWLERVLHVIEVTPRPRGYDPLARRRIEPTWVRRLGQSGADAFEAIETRDVVRLGRAMNETFACWNALLPDSFEHPSLELDWCALVEDHQRRYPGATASASGGGYLFVVSDEPVPGSFHSRIRRAS